MNPNARPLQNEKINYDKIFSTERQNSVNEVVDFAINELKQKGNTKIKKHTDTPIQRGQLRDKLNIS